MALQIQIYESITISNGFYQSFMMAFRYIKNADFCLRYLFNNYKYMQLNKKKLFDQFIGNFDD